jgi:hypothetical protein
LNLLEEAKSIVKSRSAEYGGARAEFTKLGQKWAATLGLPESIDPHLVGVMMIDLKTVRLSRGYHADSLIDVVGYSNCVQQVEDSRS